MARRTTPGDVIGRTAGRHDCASILCCSLTRSCPMHETDVVVIGAGAAGVAAARRLAAARVPTVVLEARARVGGRAWTLRGAGLPLDLGCGWLHSADENEWAAVATTVGFTIDRTPPPWGVRRKTIGFPP